MKNLNETLKALNQVTPGAGYSERSKRLILSASKKKRPVAVLGLKLSDLFRTTAFVTGSLLALVGGITIARVFVSEQPTLVASVDVQELQAEAQAVDAQLTLADAQHRAVQASEVRVSNQLSQSKTDPSLIASSQITELAIAAAGADGDASAVDEALLALLD